MSTNTTELKTNITELKNKELETIQGGLGSTILGYKADFDSGLLGASNQARCEYIQVVFS
ncbi:hypothetical protein CB0101_13995 [Synechococcus sp. CB0101]|uniref:ComC/BlpC family leader-containing pheromone/bacteriocin n=1 Tax=Synechococcus sp. CB0101 TaxID=232348 RepID=UPI0004963698|nr:ComC/BlpC family leader-containing pheromone/bacteriocin [Synechococcus sp. CB0101]QCH15865.1 hypothetical protein CB0101_13995 [Synechococcus sp. CB0101]